jgi:uncharacterized coiled-coil protein SlyX
VNLSGRQKLGGAVAVVIVAFVLGFGHFGRESTQAAGEVETIEELSRTVQELERKLEARDALITELVERMEVLERRLVAGVPAAPSAVPSSPPRPVAEAPVAPEAEPPPRLAGLPPETEPPAVPASPPRPVAEAPVAPEAEPPPHVAGLPPEAEPPAVPPSPPRPVAEAPVAPEAEPGVEPGGGEAVPGSEPGQVVVDEEAAATALERALVQRGALLLPVGVLQSEPSFAYARQETETPTRFLQDGEEIIAADEARSDHLASILTLRAGLPFESQLTLSLPYIYTNTDTVTRIDGAGEREESLDASGVGDFSVTLAKGLMRERGWRPDVIAEVSWNTDTGESDHGVELGSGFNEVAASITASKSQDPLVFVGGLSYSHAFEDDGIRPGDAFGFSLGTVLAASPETSLQFFLDNAFFMDTKVDGRDVPGSDEVVAVFTIGASSILSSRVFADVELGIGLTEAAPDYTIRVAFPIQFDLPIR